MFRIQNRAVHTTYQEVAMGLQITVQSITGERYAHSVTAGNHTLISDRLEDSGGSDLGPGPYSYLLAALGS